MRYQSRFLQISCAVLLFVCLLAGGTAYSIRHATADRNKTKTWFNQSGFYSALVQDQLTRVSSSFSDGIQLGSLNLSQADLQNAIKAAVPNDVAGKDSSTFVDSNYAWLDGKSQKPEFSIDLKPAEAAFAKNATSYISTQLDKLPACSTSQLATVAEQGTDSLLSLGCKPPGIDSSSIAKQLPDFLSTSDLTQNLKFTADDLKLSTDGSPYYRQLADAPHYFQLAKHATTYLAVGAVVLIALILVTSATIASGFRVLGWAGGLAGLLLLIGGLITRQLEHSFENSAVNKLDLGIFKTATTSLITNIVKDVAHTQLIVGATLVAVAVLIYLSPKAYSLVAAKTAK